MNKEVSFIEISINFLEEANLAILASVGRRKESREIKILFNIAMIF